MTSSNVHRLLWTSIGVNVALLAALIYFIALGHPHHQSGPPDPDKIRDLALERVDHYANVINATEEQRANVRALVIKASEEARAHMNGEPRDRFQELLQLIEHPDTPPLAEGAPREGRGAMRRLIHDTLRQISRQLTPEQRRQLVEELRKDAPSGPDSQSREK